MKENLISIETAILAESIEYNVPCWDFIDIADEESSVIHYIGDTFEDKLEHAQEFVKYWQPTQATLQKWLRETYNLDIEVWVEMIDGRKVYEPSVIYDDLQYDVEEQETGEKFSSYEEALEDALVEALKML